jgi:hypothetical protein
MSTEKRFTERILNVLKPYASNWSGTLSRGDLVIPHGEIPRLVREIFDTVLEAAAPHGEAGDRELFETLMATRLSGSVQDQMAELRKRFVILAK